MRHNKILFSFYIFIFSLFFSLSTYAQSAQGDPVSLLQYIANNMIAGLKANQATLKTKPQIVYQLAYRYVVPYADTSEMSRRVLPPHIWNNATAVQRKQFQKEFTTTLIRTYASALTSYKDQSIHFYPVRGGARGASVEVASDIEGSNMQPIRVSYRLLHVSNGWRLYDMSVEGVSMLDSFRSQFSDILSQGNMDMLLKRLSAHNRGR